MIKLGICNEMFEGWDLAGVCQFVKETGYDGLEIAPFTLAPLVTDLAPAKRREARTIVHDAGLETIGLHWLLARTEGFHLTSPEPAVRRATGEYLVALAEAALDLGGGLLVLGSPKQRSLLRGVSYDQAIGYALDVLDRAMPRIGAMGIDLCLEPLAPSETDFINTCSQAIEVIDRVDNPHFKLHLDVKAQSSETGASVAELTRRYAPLAGHFHAQDVNLRAPGMGEVDFGPIMQALVDAHYDRWVSIEVFDFAPGAQETARQGIACLKRALAAADAAGGA
ncbi:MAG: sugar phosphate isomerase/epimerase family protein [Isosphaeraceae bacterium]